MGRAHRAGGIAAGDVIGKGRAEGRQSTFQLKDKPRKHVIPSRGVLNAPDLSDQLAIEQRGGYCHCCFLPPWWAGISAHNARYGNPRRPFASCSMHGEAGYLLRSAQRLAEIEASARGCGKPSVDDENVSGNPARFVAREIDRAPAYIPAGALGAERGGASAILAGLRTEPLDHRRPHLPGRDAVDANALRPELHCNARYE